MKLVSSKKVDVNRYELEVEVSPEEFAKEVDKSYLKQKGKITIPGFRKGKAPRKFIEKYYGEQVFFEDAVNAVYGPSVEVAAKEAGVELVDDKVDFEIVKLSKEEGLVYKVKVTVMPEVEVEGYKGIEVEKKAAPKILAKDVEERIKAIQEQNARLVTSEDGKAEKGDVVNIDFEGYVDSEKFDGGTAQGVELEIGKGQFIAGFEDQVIGHKVGDEFEINVTFPETYHVASLANKPAVFKTKLNKIQKKDLPVVDDEFVKDVSEFESLEDFKKDIKKKLSDEAKARNERETETEVMDKFLELIKAEIPEALVKNKAFELVREFEYRLKSQGIAFKDYMAYTGLTVEKMVENFMPEAEKTVKVDLGLNKVAELEKISVSDEEIEKEYEAIAKVYSLKPEQAKRLVPADGLKKDMISRKTVEFICKNAVKK